MSATILVTGATGFIGRHVTEALGSAAVRVRALVRAPKARSFADRFPAAEIVEGDLLEARDLRTACRGVTAIVHCAALMADADWADRFAFERVNVEGTRGLLNAASAERVGRFIHLSSVGVLGSPARIPANENAPYGTDLSPYESSKRDAEKLVREVFAGGQLRGCILRPAQMFGPGMTHGWAETVRTLRNGSMRVIGSGDALVHLTHVKDVAEAVLLVLGHPAGASGEIFHIAGPEALPIRKVFNILAELVGAKPPSHVPYSVTYACAVALSLVPYRLRPSRVRLLTTHRVKFFLRDHAYDTTKARGVLGFSARVSVREGFDAWISDGLGRRTQD